MSDLTLIQAKGEARIDSRLLAEQLGNKHKSTAEVIERYTDKLKRFGLLPFQTEAVKTEGGRGAKVRYYYLLNEDQAFFLLALSRNSDRVVELKAGLVMAFREARASTAVNDAHYLPLYHALHDEIKQLAVRAKECGSTTPERVFHMNINKALNAAIGIASGERHSLTIDQRLVLTTLMAVYRRTLHSGLVAGNDHREAAQKAKAATLAYMDGAGRLLVAA
jgi:phage regulator Rha-like protein